MIQWANCQYAINIWFTKFYLKKLFVTKQLLLFSSFRNDKYAYKTIIMTRYNLIHGNEKDKTTFELLCDRYFDVIFDKFTPSNALCQAVENI